MLGFKAGRERGGEGRDRAARITAPDSKGGEDSHASLVDEATGQPRGWWVCNGDTGPNPLLWQRLRSMKVAHLVRATLPVRHEQRRP